MTYTKKCKKIKIFWKKCPSNVTIIYVSKLQIINKLIFLIQSINCCCLQQPYKS